MIKRIIFDIDGTLITGVDFSSYVANTLKKYGIEDIEKTKQFLLNIKEYENSLKNPLKSLIDRLSNKSLVRETLPDRVLRHKLKKYKIDFAEFWTHPSSRMHYVIVNDPANDMKILVTVFVRTVND